MERAGTALALARIAPPTVPLTGFEGRLGPVHDI